MALVADKNIKNALAELFKPLGFGDGEYDLTPDATKAAQRIADLTNTYQVSRDDIKRAAGTDDAGIDAFLKAYGIDPKQYFGANTTMPTTIKGYLDKAIEAAGPTPKQTYKSVDDVVNEVIRVAKLTAGDSPSKFQLDIGGTKYDPTAENIDRWLEAQVAQAGAAPAAPTYDAFSLDNWKDPGYEFRQRRGEQALNRASAARGQFFSGRAGKELAEFNSDLASQEYGNAYNRYLQSNEEKRSQYSTSRKTYEDDVRRNLGMGTQALNTGLGKYDADWSKWKSSLDTAINTTGNAINATAAADTEAYNRWRDTVNRNLGTSTQALNTSIGLDDTNYQRTKDYWDMLRTVDNDTYNRLMGFSSAGAAASSTQPPSVAPWQVGAGNADAGGAIRISNAITDAVNNALRSYSYNNNPWAAPKT